MEKNKITFFVIIKCSSMFIFKAKRSTSNVVLNNRRQLCALNVRMKEP